MDWQHMKQLPSYLPAVLAIKGDPAIGNRLDRTMGFDSMGPVSADSALRAMVLDSVERVGSLTFDPSVFEDAFSRFQEQLASDVMPTRFLAPLDGFNTTADRIDLGDSLAIVRLSDDEKERLLAEGSFGFSYSRVLGVVNRITDFALETFDAPKKVFDQLPEYASGTSPREKVEGKFERVCDALRVFKAGRVTYDYIRVIHDYWEPLLGYGGYLRRSGAPNYGSPYDLRSDEIKSFTEFWRSYQMQDWKKLRQIGLAVRRLSFGYERTRPEDRLIDSLIGFEALLLSNERQELEYRLALRGAVLLGDSPDQRATIFAELRSAYGQRSNIVHGGSPDADVKIAGRPVPFDTFVSLVEDHLRAVIREFLERCATRTISTLVKELDEAIVSGQLLLSSPD
jgi:hypothetical protein